MFKTKILSILFILFSVVSFGQGLPGKSGGTSETTNTGGERIDFSNKQELKNDIQEVAGSVAYKLMRCCSSWGGNNVRGEVNWNECTFNKLRNTYSVIMTASWTGSLSGNQYWIKGKLILRYYDNGNGGINETRTWEKIADSGGFSPGCGKDCSVN
jgi:hypothetical protein